MSSGTGTKRPPGRPSNATRSHSNQKSTINAMFAAANNQQSPNNRQKKKTRQSNEKTPSTQTAHTVHDPKEPLVPIHQEDNAIMQESDEQDDNVTDKGVATPIQIDEETTHDDDEGTPPRKNSTKKRSRKRGVRGVKKTTQTSLFGKDRRYISDGEYYTRFDISFRLEDNNNPPEQAQLKFQKILNAMQEHSDPTISILP